MTSKLLRVLLIEDREDDAFLLLRELRRAGWNIVHERVETAETMTAALGRGPWDIVLADYSLPHFSAKAALDVLKKSRLDLPFIVISGSIGEDAAVALMRAGAHDYLSKNSLGRLAPLIERELRDASARRSAAAAEESLEMMRRRLDTVVSVAPMALYQASGSNDYVDWASDSIEQLMGFSAEEFMTNRSLWSERLHPEDRARYAGTAVGGFEFRWRLPSGEYRWFLSHEVCHTDSDGVLRRVGCVTDIDDRKRVEEHVRHANDALEERVAARTADLAALNEDLREQIAIRERAVDDRKIVEEQLKFAKEAAEAASRAKSEFLATMSHELRTPLNAIIGFSELLEDTSFGELQPRQKKFVQNVQAAGRHLLALINDVLDLAKVEAGRVELFFDRFEVATAFDNARSLVATQARERGVLIAIETPAEPLMIQADEGKFRQIMLNLMSNAVKFTPEGGIVTVSAKQLVSEGQSDLQVSVTDTGIGIAESDQDRIFRAFEQVDSSYSRNQQGTGLGLPLTRRLVELHGGRMWVESKQGVGSTFHFTLPLERRRMSSKFRRVVVGR